jgi:hypothetical protein
MSNNLPELPVELQIEILKKSDPETILNFCKYNNIKIKNTCNYLFKFLLKTLKFENLNSTFDYNLIYPNIYYANIKTFGNKNIILENCFNELFVKSLLEHDSYSTIHFLQTQNVKSICFDMSDKEQFFIAGNDREFEDEATEIYKNSFLFDKCPLKRGDIIRFKLDDYLSINDGKFIYDGKNFHSLDFEINENGSCPKEFLVINEFAIKYFTESILNNSIVHTDISEVELNELKFDSFGPYHYILYNFYKNNKKYGLFVYTDDNNFEIKLKDILSKIKSEETYYEAGIDPYIFDKNEIDKINKIISYYDISIDNVVSLYMRELNF